MPELGKAYVQIIPSAEGISGKIEEVLEPEAQSSGKKIGTSLAGNIGTAIKGASALVVGATTAVTGAVLKGTSGVASYGDNIDKMSQKMGISAQGYQEWEAVMQHSGTSMETMKASMKTMANAVENGNDAFQRIGLSVEDLNTMSNEEIFNATIKGLQNVDNETQRTYLAGQLLGRGATELGALLNTSAEDTQAMKDRVSELGGVMSNEAVKNAAAFQDNLQDLQTAFSGVGRGIMSELMPGMTQIMGGFTSLIAGEKGASQAISDGFNTLFTSLGKVTQGIVGHISEMLPTLVSGFASILPQVIGMATQLIISLGQALISALPTLITTVLPALAKAAIDIVIALGKGLAQAAPKLVTAGATLIQNLRDSIDVSEMLAKGTDVINNILNGITTALPSVLNAGVNILTQIVNGILKNLPQIAKTAIDIVTSLAKFILQNLPTILNAGVQLILSLVKGVVNNLPQLVQAITSGLAQFVAAIISSLPEILAQGIEIIVKLAAGIVQAIPKIIAILPQVINAIKNGFTSVNWAELGTKLLDGVKNGIKNAVSKVTSAISDTAKAIQNKFKGVNWSSLGSDLLEKIKSGIKNAISKVQSAISDVTTAIKDKFKNFDFKAIGTDILDRIKNGIGDAIEKIKTKIGDVTKAIKGVFDNFNFKDIGKNMLNGIGEGITGAASSLISTLWGAVEGAIKWVKNKLGIESPSRLMADTVGKYMALGLGQGFEDNMPEVDMADAVLNTTAAMTQATQSGIDTNTTEINYQLLYEAVKAGASAANVELYFNNREVARSLRDIGVTVG